MTTEISELKVSAALVDGEKEVATVEKVFGVIPEHEVTTEEKNGAKSIDSIVNEFMQEVQTSAGERGYIADNLSMAEVSVRIILFLVKHVEPELKLMVQLTKPKPEEKPKPNTEEKEDGDKADS